MTPHQVAIHPNGTDLSNITKSIVEEESNNYANDRHAGQNDRHAEQRLLISVASFNLLAPLYVRPIDLRTGEVQPFAAFEWVKDDEILNWDSRKLRLLETIRSCRADVICLQELQVEKKSDNNNDGNDETWQIPEWLTPLIDECGYEAILPSQETLSKMAARNLRVLGVDAAVTCAVLVKVEQQHQQQFNDVDDAVQKQWGILGTHQESNNVVSVCLHSKLHPQMDPVVVSCVHLDAKDEAKRVSQLSKALQFTRTLLDEHAAATSTSEQQQQLQQTLKEDNELSNSVSAATTPGKRNNIPLTAILAGDMNAEFLPGSCLQACLCSFDNTCITEQELLDVRAKAYQFHKASNVPSLDEWKMIQQNASSMVTNDYCTVLDRVRTGPTRCAYNDEDEDDDENDNGQKSENTAQSSTATTTTTMATWKLDHFLYTPDRLIPLAQWDTLEADPESCQTGLPNAKHATSDHLPIGCVFQMSPSPDGFNKNCNDDLMMKRIESLNTKHMTDVQELEGQMETERIEIEKRLQQKQSKDIEESRGNTLKSKRIARPPKEVIACLQKKRSLMKKLHQEQQAERQNLAKTLDRWQKFCIQGCFGKHWAEWVEQGMAS